MTPVLSQDVLIITGGDVSVMEWPGPVIKPGKAILLVGIPFTKFADGDGLLECFTGLHALCPTVLTSHQGSEGDFNA